MNATTIARHGLDQEAFAALLAHQSFACPICDRWLPDAYDVQIDHDHACCPGDYSCGACVRGLLCAGCNGGLGSFHDDPIRLAAGIVELESVLYPCATVGLCALCGGKTTTDYWRRCFGCTVGLGHFRYEPERLRRALDYLASDRRWPDVA